MWHNLLQECIGKTQNKNYDPIWKPTLGSNKGYESFFFFFFFPRQLCDTLDTYEYNIPQGSHIRKTLNRDPDRYQKPNENNAVDQG